MPHCLLMCVYSRPYLWGLFKGFGWRLLFGGDHANQRYKSLRWQQRKSDVQKYALCGQPMGKKHIRRVNQRGCTTVVLLV